MIIKWPDNRREHRGINLVCYGSSEPEGYTAMAQTVGFPCAIATRMVLDKEIQRKGMVLPFTKDIYKPMLDRSVKFCNIFNINDSNVKDMFHSHRNEFIFHFIGWRLKE